MRITQRAAELIGQIAVANYSLHSIDQAAFDAFVTLPSSDQLEAIALAMKGASGETENWAPDSVRRRLAAKNWYVGIGECDLPVWESALCSVLERSEFDVRIHGEHGSISDMFVELASQAYADRGVDATVRKFWPYRFFDLCVRTRIGRDPQLERFVDYAPGHALLTNPQVGQFLDEVSEYDNLLHELSNKNPRFVELWRDEAIASLREATSALTEIYNSNRLWYAQFDY